MFGGRSPSILLSFSSIQTEFSIHFDVQDLNAVFENGDSVRLNYKLKNDEFSNWIFSNEDNRDGTKSFHGVFIDKSEIKSDTHKLRLTAKVSNVSDDDQASRISIITEILIGCDNIKNCDEVFRNISFDFLNSTILLECRILCIYALPEALELETRVLQISNSLGKPRFPYLVGHRGLGQELGLAITENTIYGYNRCAYLNLDFVELDVHFSKDDEIIVFHDFFMDAGGKQEIRLLTHDEIMDQVAARNHRGIFPTLEQVLEEVDQRVGLLIEMKYPQLLCDGRRENGCLSNDPRAYYLQKNEYVDRIFSTILRKLSSRPRRIVLISFDPDICLLLAIKQSIFPVMFITRGRRIEGIVNHADSRLSHYRQAVSWATFCGLQGVITRYDQKLEEDYKSLANDRLLTFLYGVFPRDDLFYQQCRSLGIDGLIIDDPEDYLRTITRSS